MRSILLSVTQKVVKFAVECHFKEDILHKKRIIIQECVLGQKLLDVNLHEIRYFIISLIIYLSVCICTCIFVRMNIIELKELN